MTGSNPFIYNTGLVNPAIGSRPNVLLVDSSTLVTLSKADTARSGTDTTSMQNLDLLLKSGREVIITSTVQNEVASDAGVNQGFTDSVRINNWIRANGAAGTRSFCIPSDDAGTRRSREPRHPLR
jgi:hypothetical protein